MANIVITTDGARFKVTSNNVDTGFDYDYVWPEDIEHVQKNGCVVLSFHDERFDWEFSIDGNNGTWEIDSISGSEMTTLDILATAIANMKG